MHWDANVLVKLFLLWCVTVTQLVYSQRNNNPDNRRSNNNNSNNRNNNGVCTTSVIDDFTGFDRKEIIRSSSDYGSMETARVSDGTLQLRRASQESGYEFMARCQPISARPNQPTFIGIQFTIRPPQDQAAFFVVLVTAPASEGACNGTSTTTSPQEVKLGQGDQISTVRVRFSIFDIKENEVIRSVRFVNFTTDGTHTFGPIRYFTAGCMNVVPSNHSTSSSINSNNGRGNGTTNNSNSNGAQNSASNRNDDATNTSNNSNNGSSSSNERGNSTSTTSGRISPDNVCGPRNGFTCGPNACCSSNGFCGVTTAYCGTGCQEGFGSCGPRSLPQEIPVSTDGKCGYQGPGNIFRCPSTPNSACCSAAGRCGTGIEFCGVVNNGCQSAFGRCGSQVNDPPANSFPPIDFSRRAVWNTQCRQNGLFALTFDDGPSTLTSDLLQVLARNNVRATFFVNGYYKNDLTVEPFNRILWEAFNAGHQIASHGYEHLDMTQLDVQTNWAQLWKNDRVIHSIIGRSPVFFRPPFGSNNPETLAMLGSWGYRTVWQNLDSLDALVEGQSDALRRMAASYNATFINANPQMASFISLQHDTVRVTVESWVQMVIDNVRARGYQFVTIGECLGLPDPATWYRDPTQWSQWAF